MCLKLGDRIPLNFFRILVVIWSLPWAPVFLRDFIIFIIFPVPTVSNLNFSPWTFVSIYSLAYSKAASLSTINFSWSLSTFALKKEFI